MLSSIPLQGAGSAEGIIGLIGLLILIAIVYWTYTDAKANSNQPAFLWAIVVFLAPLLGLLIYFLLGRGKA